MTNKDSIQQKHLEAINDDNNWTSTDDVKDVQLATSCTTVTADAIGEAMEWAAINGWDYNLKKMLWYIDGKGDYTTTKELVQLFLNQKAPSLPPKD